MKILVERDKLLTNYEVLRHLNSASTRFRESKRKTRNPSVQQVLSYLKERPAGNEQSPQTEEGIIEFMKATKDLELEKAERLQLINSAPSSLPVLYNLVEECEERYTDSQLNELLNLSEKFLGSEHMPEVKG